jgi:NAD(P)-dependent dehydrogenase (short-subunit alcohol dehydrogenase family)
MTDDPTPPTQQQQPPGRTEEMTPRPHDEMVDYRGTGLLEGKRALVTGGDSGIGRAVAIAFAKEGANVVISYLSEEADAKHTAEKVRAAGGRCLTLRADLTEAAECERVVQETAEGLGGLEILVNNQATQAEVDRPEDISDEQWLHTFQTNVHSYFRVTRAALRYLDRGDSVINTGSVNGMRGNKKLIDYSATKGAIHALTYSLAQALVDRGIRVNCVAPGPVWTPLIPATLDPDHVGEFGANTPMGRPADPDEIAPSYVFFASDRLSSYYTGEVLAPVGGEIVSG